MHLFNLISNFLYRKYCVVFMILLENWIRGTRYLKKLLFRQHYVCSCSDVVLYVYMYIILREKGRDLTQSYDKSPYTNRNVKGQSDNTNNATKNSIT